jgi:tetrahydromethanopterin S-methyltransferase subunit B
MTDEIFDFGFTIVDEAELDAVQAAQQSVAAVSTSVDETKEKLDKLYNAIQPLLNNLKANPDKDYILWPNRLEKVESFEDFIQDIYTGKK